MDQATDEELMAAVASGDRRAFHALVGRHQGRAFRVAFRMMRNKADAEDVTQEALLRVWTNAASWRPTAAFATWLYRVVVNLAIDRQRAQQRRGPHAPLDEADALADPGPDPAQAAVQGETGRLIAAAVAALPDRQRAALVLAHFEGLSNAEAAEALGTSISGVEALLVRARRALKDRLGPALGG
jgi:RNA polymerase sigma-70 factor (ECF subfamily)